MNICSAKASSRNLIKVPVIFIPIVMFVLFDVVALGLNVWISEKLETNALTINLSGRQRMLSQRMSKSLLMLQTAKTDVRKQLAFDEFTSLVDLFDSTLKAFAYGGNTLSGQGEPIYLHAIEGKNGQFIADQTIQIWSIVQQKISPVLELGTTIDETALTAAVDTLLHHNIQILKLMNDLTSVFEQNAYHEVFELRILQGSLLVLAFLNFIIVFKRLINQVNQFQNNLQSLSSVIDSIETGVLIVDNKKLISSSNKAAKEIFGFHDNTFIGKPMSEFVVSDGERCFGKRTDKSIFSAKVNTQTLHDFDGEIGLCTIIDRTEQERREKKLMQLAFHDPLTGLPNRVLLHDRLSQELLRAKRESKALAVMFVDLDGFKPINDALGHNAGDELLRQVSKRFQQNCRAIDTVARVGGDEFVFVLSSLSSLKVVRQVVKNILWATSQTFSIGEKTVHVGVSIGIAVYPDNESNADLLVKYADEAMYQAKQNGKNSYVFWSQSAKRITL